MDSTTPTLYEPQLTGSAARALRVLALVLEDGPVSAAQLTERSGLSRTAVHRAIHALIDAGFVRYQLGKMTVVGTAEMRGRVEGAFFSPPRIDAISSAVDTGLRHRRLQAEIAVLSKSGEFALVETTAPEAEPEIEFFESDLVSVLLSHFDPVEVTRITAKALRESGEGAKVEATYLDRFRQAQYQGYLWNPQQKSLAVRLSGDSEQSIAVRLFAKGSARASKKEFVETMAEMRDVLPQVFPKIAIIDG